MHIIYAFCTTLLNKQTFFHMFVLHACSFELSLPIIIENLVGLGNVFYENYEPGT